MKAFGTFLDNLDSFDVFVSDLELFADSDSKNLTTNYPLPLAHDRIGEKVTQLIEILDETLKIKAKISKYFPSEVTDNLFKFAEYIAKKDYGQQRITLKLIERQEQELTEINVKLEKTGRHDLEHASEEAMQLQLRKQELEDNLNTFLEYYDSNVQILYDTARHMPEEYLHMMSASWGYYGSFKNAMQSKLNSSLIAANSSSCISGKLAFIVAETSVGTMYGLEVTGLEAFTITFSSTALIWIISQIMSNKSTEDAREIQKLLPEFVIKPNELAKLIFTEKMMKTLDFKDETAIKSSFMMQLHKAEQNQPLKWHHKLVNNVLCCCCRKAKKFDLESKAYDDVHKLFIKFKSTPKEKLQAFDLCEIEERINRNLEEVDPAGASSSGANQENSRETYRKEISEALTELLGTQLSGVSEHMSDMFL